MVHPEWSVRVVRKLQSENYNNIVTSRSKDLDCRNQADVDSFFAKHKFDVVVIAGCKSRRDISK